jgi:hypothetical protein
MKRVCLIAAGVLALGAARARAEVGATDKAAAAPEEAPAEAAPEPMDVPPSTGVPGSPEPPPPATGVPGTVETTPGTSATMPSGTQPSPPPAVDVENPPLKPPPVAQPTQREVMPPAQMINNNAAAISGAVTEPTTPVPPLGAPIGHTGYNRVPIQHTWVSQIGGGLLVGGGVEDFTDSSVRSVTGVGGSWTARVVAGTRQLVGLEGAYVGAARSLNTLGVSSNANLVANGFEGAVRVNVPVLLRRGQLLEPFGFVGVGWSHYQVTNTNVNTSDVARDDDVLALPLGGGLEYAIGRFMADARFTYRSTYYNDLMRTGGNLNNWGVSGQVGFSF